MIFRAVAVRLIQSITVWGILIGTVSLQVSFGQQNPPRPAAQPSVMPKLFPPTPSQSGIAYFRELLAAKPEEREKLLAEKTAEHRRILENGVRTYEALSPEERELRLRTMELRYQVTSLLRVAPTNRAERLKQVPEKDRRLVEDRLNYWDNLSPDEQTYAMEYERLARILGFSVRESSWREIPLTGQTSNQVRQIERQLVRWQTLPETRRVQIQKNFQTLFEFSDTEKAREKLQPLPLNEEERQLMQATLDRFQKLAPLQRANCIKNFEKFAELSPAERRQFLLNAQEWQKMKPEDREAWRKLVSKVPRMPPLPPGLGQPPLPRRALPPAATTAVATNHLQ
jgi:hypothetical protein